jgi:hypothetical protein
MYQLISPAETHSMINVFSVVNFFSFITLVKYMRRVGGLREYITLIFVALEKMVYFIIVIMVFLLGFATSLRIKPMEMNSPDHFGGQSWFAAMFNQYKLIFGDFGPWDDFKGSETPPDWVDTTFFLAISLIMTMILFNMIVTIFCEAYAELKEIRVAVDI